MQIDLVLQAGVNRKIEMAGYNGPANWAFAIGTPASRPLPPDNPQFTNPIEGIPGIHLNGNGDFVPEPSALALLMVGIGLIGTRRLWFRGSSARQG